MQNAVSILRELWRRPRLEVVALALVALVIGGLVAYQPSLPPKRRQYSVGTSSVRILVDTTDSRVVAIAPPDQTGRGRRISAGTQVCWLSSCPRASPRQPLRSTPGSRADKLIMIAPTEPEPEG